MIWVPEGTEALTWSAVAGRVVCAEVLASAATAGMLTRPASVCMATVSWAPVTVGAPGARGVPGTGCTSTVAVAL